MRRDRRVESSSHRHTPLLACVSGVNTVSKHILRLAVVTSCGWATSALALDVGSDTTVGGRVYFDVSHISLQNEDAVGVSHDLPPTGTGFDRALRAL